MFNAVIHKRIPGFYPERKNIPEKRLESLWRNYGVCYRFGLRRATRNLQHVVDAINSHEQKYSALSEAALTSEIKDLRKELRLHGTSADRAYRSFALTREVAGQRLGMRHFDVQLMGGWVLLNSMVAEMKTGEGKTLTATLPACTMAMTGIPTHIITVNDYLAKRDSSLMQPIYEAMGVSLGVIQHGMSLEERQRAYGCDVVYCTNKELVFDFLKDHLRQPQRPGRIAHAVQGLYGSFDKSTSLNLRGLYYAIVDEVDSVMIDEARTPLVISGDGNSAFEEQIYHQAIAFARRLHREDDFTIDQNKKKPELTLQGRSRGFELTAEAGGFWNVTRMREMFLEQALTALYCFKKEVDYLVKDDKVEIVDEYTGRLMADRTWERGLHQMIESKEECTITTLKDTLAKMTYQRFFRRYHLLAGMTGTAQEVARELWSVYRLRVVTIKTNKPLVRRELQKDAFSTAEEKINQIAAKTRELHNAGRPVLIGTPSVEASERISGQLTLHSLPHHTLNAKQDKQEAEIIAQAGCNGNITVATNMAGRGTDIQLEPGVAELGGLHVIASERHSARRIDRQLFGRCGRQGDPGTFAAYVSFEDDLFKPYTNSILLRLLLLVLRLHQPTGQLLTRRFTRYAQMKIERRYCRIRRDLLKHDESMERVLAFSGEGE